MTKFRSPSDARGRALEIIYALAHPHEIPMTKEEAETAGKELTEIRNYLEECEEQI